MVVGAKVCDLTEDLLWFVCGLYVGMLTSSLIIHTNLSMSSTPVLKTLENKFSQTSIDNNGA